MKKNSNPTQIILIVLVLVVLLVFVGYRFLLTPLQEEKKKKEDENYELEVRKIELQNKKSHETEYKKSIAEAQEQINKVMNRFAAGNTPEKSIMMIKDMEELIGVEVPAIGFNENQEVTSVNLPKINDTPTGDYTIEYYDITLNKSLLSVDYNCDYDQLKMVMDFLNMYAEESDENMTEEAEEREKMNLNSIECSFDNETGKLTGNMVINLYSVEGGDKVYDEKNPDWAQGDDRIDSLMLHKDNIFSK